MKVALTVNDFLDRAELVYGDRVGVVDEPDQPAPSLGRAHLPARSASWPGPRPPALDDLGVGAGERVAIVSQNAARLLTSFFGVSGSGRVLVPINFRLNADGGRLHRRALGRLGAARRPRARRRPGRRHRAKHRFVHRRRGRRRAVRLDRRARAVGRPTRTPPPPSTTRAAPRPGPRACSSPTATSGSTPPPSAGRPGVSDRDVYLHTLPMFHCNGWGMPYAVTGMGGTHVVLRKVDGAEILRRVERARRHAAVRRAGRRRRRPRRRRRRGTGRSPAPGRTRIVVAGAPPPTRTIERVETELGWEFIQIYGLTETTPLLTMNRGRAECDDLSPGERAARLGRAGAPALGVQLRVDDRGRGAGPRQRTSSRATGSSPRRRPTPSSTAGSTPATAASSTTSSYLTISDRKKDVIISGGENVSSIEVEDALFSHPAVAEVARHRRARREVGRDGEGARRAGAGRDGDRGTSSSTTAATAWPTTSARPSVEFRDELARTATGKLQKFKLRAAYWEGRERQVN